MWIWCWKWGKETLIIYIHNRKPFWMHISFLFCWNKGNGWFTSTHPLDFPLWQSYTLAFTRKSKNLSLLVVKEREEGGLTEWSYTTVPHKSFLIRIAPEVQVEITNGFAMRCRNHLKDLPHSLFFSLSELNLDRFIVITRVSPSEGLSEKGNCPASLSRHYLNVFACRKALWLAHRERTTLLKWPCYNL